MGLILNFVGALCWPVVHGVEERLFKARVHMTALRRSREHVLSAERQLAGCLPLEELRAWRARAELALIAYRESALSELAGCTNSDCACDCELASDCSAYQETIIAEYEIRARLRKEEVLTGARDGFALAWQDVAGRGSSWPRK